jgi:TatD DNase family protein
MMRLSDTHCHLDLNNFDEDRAAVLERAWQAGLTRILIPALTLSSSRSTVKLAKSHPWLFTAIGVHPNEATTWNEQSAAELEELANSAANSKKIVAIGEIGLDYYRDYAPPELQKTILQRQLELAAKLDLPVIIHLREVADARSDGPCTADLMDILRDWAADLKSGNEALAERPGVLHSFSGSLETAQAAIQLGFFIGISGPVTFKNARQRQAITTELPLERLLTETDAPFLAPHPHRGQRNEPSYVKLMAEQIASLHSRSLEEIAAITSANANRLFRWGESD